VKSNLGTLFFALFALAIVVIIYGHQPWTPLRIAGAALALPSLILFVIARIQLGKMFSVRAQATQLVTSGLYSRIRNPIYVFGALTLAGIFLFINKPWLLLAFVVLLPLQLRRARAEEQVLTEKFGDQYLRYKSQTWF
jgi:protein-S-isoprenylcysteine O-methyltransferase Ste14